MPKAFAFLIALASLAIVGCNSTPTRVNTGAIKAQTFSFINGGSTTHAEIAEKREMVHQSIQNSITNTLGKKGLTKVSANGDVTIAYLVIVGDNVSTEAIGKYFGYNDDQLALQDKAHAAYMSNKNPNNFRAGTLLIDVIDGKTFKLLQRNYSVRPLQNNVSPEERDSQIQSAVDEIFEKLHVSK